jgi:hypothetical protein
MNRYFLLTVIVLVVLAGCRKSKTESAAKRSNIDDACALITSAELQAIQSAPVKDTKGSDQSDGQFRITQCFYTTDPFNKSVSLAVTQRDPVSPSARDPKEFWQQTFGRYESEMRERKGDEDEKKKSLQDADEERGRPPKKIEGVGDDAFWTANRLGGAIYVLKNNVFIRISVGGPETEESKIERSKALAAKALSRL